MKRFFAFFVATSNYKDMNFLSFINSFTAIPPHVMDELFQSMQHEKVPKNHRLHDEGKICYKLYIVQKGLARLFHYKDSKDVTSWFASENQLITAPESFFSQKPDRYNIEMVEESELLSITHADLEKLFEKYPEMERLGRLMAYQTIIQLSERLYAINFFSAQERYKVLVENHPNIIQRAPLRHIASYLGIEQETLSRIRGKV